MNELHPDVSRVAEDIDTMAVRGAAKIADVAAGALRAQAEASDADSPESFRAEMRAAARVLLDTRPSAVSLPNTMRFVLRDMSGVTVEDLREDVIHRADEFRTRLETAQRDLGEVGANRLRDGDVVMLHCHSTAVVSCLEAAVEQGKELSAIVKETRPRNQGHITAKQLAELGVPVTLIVDNAARRYLNDVDHVLVGADSIAADGSVINKIGTSGLAVNARDRGTPIVVAAQTLKLDPATLTGHNVEIEMRDAEEVISAARGAELGDPRVENPAFDVTPPRYLDAVVTERGQFPPESIVVLMRELFGDSVSEPWVEP
ncbi:MAG: ribose 1,5-bisphosphate isomerase [Halobacteriota archaeon]